MRSTGWAMLSASSVQEAHDLAAVAHADALRTRLSFLHFFDGLCTPYEVLASARCFLTPRLG